MSLNMRSLSGWLDGPRILLLPEVSVRQFPIYLRGGPWFDRFLQVLRGLIEVILLLAGFA